MLARVAGVGIFALLLALVDHSDARAAGTTGGAQLQTGQEAPIAPTLSAGAGFRDGAAFARPMRVSTMWDGDEWVDREDTKPLPPGMKVKVTAAELEDAYGLKPNQLLNELEDDVATSGKLMKDYWEQHVTQMGDGGMTRGRHMPPAAPKAAEKKAVPPPPSVPVAKAPPTKMVRAQHAERKEFSKKVPAKLPGNQESRRIKAGAGERSVRGQVLSPIGQEEMGHNPRGQACPDYGLDSTEFKVVGFAASAWRKTVQIRSMEGEVLGIVKRSCPSWGNSFIWKVPDAHASGCRNDVDPNVFSSKCQMPEVEVLYTDEFSGMIHPTGISIMDCHDDKIFSLVEEHRQVIIHEFKIKSDYLIKDLNGNIMGYCRQDTGPGRSLPHVGDHNFTIVDLEGEIFATATRPLHWANGAEEHVWNVEIVQDPVPLTLSDMRIVAAAVVNNVLIHEKMDLCSDVVFMLAPMLITLCFIGIVAALSTVISWLRPTPLKVKP